MNPVPSTHRAQASINVTPLIDIVLVLLIVFIVLVPGLAKSLSVAVPATEIVQPGQASPETLVVTLDPQGKLFLQREELPLDELCAKLVPAVMMQPLGLRKVFLKVAGDLPHFQAIRVLDQIRLASERARQQTLLRPGYGAVDGGDIRVAVTLLKAPVA